MPLGMFTKSAATKPRPQNIFHEYITFMYGSFFPPLNKKIKIKAKNSEQVFKILG